MNATLPSKFQVFPAVAGDSSQYKAISVSILGKNNQVVFFKKDRSIQLKDGLVTYGQALSDSAKNVFFLESILAIYDFWSTGSWQRDVQFEKIGSEDVQRAHPMSGKYPVLANSKAEYVVGDIHGDLHHLLMNLLVSGVARFKVNEPNCLFYNLNTMKKSFDLDEITVQGQYEEIRVIPNLELNLSFDQSITFLGDILDRGRHSDECLCLLTDLFDEQKQKISLLGQKKMHWVMGDHEIYGLMHDDHVMTGGHRRGIPFNENYLEIDIDRFHDNNNSWNVDVSRKSLAFVAKLIRHNIRQGHLEYARLGENGVFYSHSYLTRSFMGKLLKQLESDEALFGQVFGDQKTRENLKELIVDFLGAIDNEKAGIQLSKHYIDRLKEFERSLNRVLVNTVQYFDGLAGDSDKISEIITSVCLFSLSDDCLSPIWAKSNPLPIVQAVGHDAQKSNHQISHFSKRYQKPRASLTSRIEEKPEPSLNAYVYLFDTASSHGISTTEKGSDLISNPRVGLIDEEGQILMGKLHNKSTIPVFELKKKEVESGELGSSVSDMFDMGLVTAQSTPF